MRFAYSNFAQDSQGDALESATVNVYLAGTGTVATIYNAYSGGDVVTSVATSSNGQFTFYVDDTDYDGSQQFKVVISKPLHETTTLDYLSIIPSSPTDGSDTTLHDHDGVGKLAEAAEWTRQQNFNEALIVSVSNEVAWNLDLAQCAAHVMTENTTIKNPTNMNAGGTYILRLLQQAGVYTISWDTSYEWGEQSAPAEPAANGDVVIVSFFSDGSIMYGSEFCRKEA